MAGRIKAGEKTMSEELRQLIAWSILFAFGTISLIGLMKLHYDHQENMAVIEWKKASLPPLVRP